MIPKRTFLFLLLCACGGEAAPAPVVAEHLVSAPPPAPAAPATPLVESAPTNLTEAGAEYLPNGNLLVTKPGAAWIFDGKGWKARELAAETAVVVERSYGSPQASLVVGNKGGWSSRYDSLELLSPTDLGTMYRGQGRMVDGVVALPNLHPNGQAPGANDPVDDTSLVLEHGGALRTLQLPTIPRGNKEVTAVRLEGELAVVTWQIDTKIFADAYALGTGKRLGSAAPHDALYPISTMVGSVQYYIAVAPPPAPAAPHASSSSSSVPPPIVAGSMPVPAVGYEEGSPRRALVVRDVKTGLVLRQRTIPCKGQLANPTVSPDESTVLVTCQDTAIVMDGRSLAERRRIAHVIPGCDNGLDLTGHLENGGTLVVEGCMGVARLSLATGRYLCGDGAGVMGAPYEPMSNQKFTKPKAPRCTAGGDEVSQQPLGSRGNYSYLFEEKVVVGPGQARLQLEPDTSMPVLSRTEDRMVYVNGGQLVVRELPSGKVLELPRK